MTSNINSTATAVRDLLSFKREIKNDLAKKILLSLAILVAAIAAVVFVGSDLFAMGIGTIVLTTVAIAYLTNKYQKTTKIFNRAAAELSQNI